MNLFPFGRAAASIVVLMLVSGLILALTPAPKRTATLVYWTFAKPHYESYLKNLPAFEAAHPGVSVDLELVSNTALASRLQAAFLADLDVPDMCELEIGTAGSMFRGPLKDIGFADLTDRIHKPDPATGKSLWDRVVQARFSTYTSRGHIFGLPHDVHPMQIAYNRVALEKEGINPDSIKTWDDFIKVGRKLTIPGKRYMIQFSDSDAGLGLEACLFQRGGGYFDPNENVIFDNETAAQTMEWYVPLVAGPHLIGNDLGGGQFLTQAVEQGYFYCLICPDWRTKSIENDIPNMSGKMALMDFPLAQPGGCPTSTWGGTMLGITKRCKNQDLAWELYQAFYLDKASLGERFRQTNILPPLREAWNEPAFQEPRPYWSNQKIGARYAALAPSVPFQYTSPLVVNAKSKLSEALVACVQYYKAHGDAGFDGFVRVQLKHNADQVRALARRNPY